MKIIKSLIILLFVLLLGCSEKKSDKQPASENNQNSTLTDDGYTLKINYRTGDKFKYHLSINNINSISRTNQTGKEQNLSVTASQEFTYSGEVVSQDSSGDVDIRMKILKIKITSESPQGNISFDSDNPSDASKLDSQEFLQFGALLNNEYFIRLTSKGEISEVYRVDNIMRKLLGDKYSGMKDNEKTQIRTGLENQLRGETQQIFQVLPEKKLKVDSLWGISDMQKIGELNLKLTKTYTLKGISKVDNRDIANISAKLTSELSGKKSQEDKQKGIKYNIEKLYSTGNGMVEFDLEKGYVVKRDLTVMSEQIENMTQGSQSVHAVNKSTNKVKVELIK